MTGLRHLLAMGTALAPFTIRAADHDDWDSEVYRMLRSEKPAATPRKAAKVDRTKIKAARKQRRQA